MNHDYLIPGISAALAALLFPLYWIIEVSYTVSSGELRAELGLLDVLYFLVGGLVAFLFFNLKRFLNEQYEYHSADIILTVIIAFMLISYVGSFLLAQYGSETAFYAFFVGTIIGAGILDIVLGVLLIRASAEISSGIKTFAAINIFLGVTEVTLVLSIATIIVYPICALVLCATFLREPNELQIV